MLSWALVAGLYAVSVAASTSAATSCPCDAFTNHTALIDFYYQTQGPHWSPAVPSNVTGWGTHLPVCEWTGLSCEGNLLVMELTWFFLNGTIPTTFWADVKNLGNITFASASIYYPPDFKGATKLQDITYYGDSSGNICLPDAWAELPNLLSIRAFNVGVLTCNLPTSWGAMSKLQTLIMPYTFPSNQALPASWSGMTSLQVLDLSNSILNGTIPDTWSSWRQLRSFQLFSCVALGGNLPAWLGNNTHLTLIALGSNAFVGSLPEEWSNARGLTYIDVSGNQLTGPLPPTWGRLSNLTTLWLSSNTLTGTLPPSWVGLGSLTTLQLQYNHLTGPIPATWYSLLHHDFNCAGQYAGCKQVTFNNNWLTGTPDLCLFAQLNVSLTAVANNNFTGMPDISCFPNGCNSQRVQAAFTGNHFCGECSENYCNCTVLEGETIAEDRSLSIIETSSTVTCCTSCQTTPGCVAAVFFSIAGLHYCDLKNVSSPLVAKTGYSVLRW